MNNMSVGQRLLLILGAPLAVLVLMAGLAVNMFSQINEGVARIYDDRVIPLGQLKQVSDAYSQIIRVVTDADSGLTLPEDALSVIEAQQRKIRESWALYLKADKTPAESEAVQKAEKQFKSVNDVIETTRAILQGLNNSLTFNEDGSTPLTESKEALHDEQDPIGVRISELIAVQIDQAAVENNAANALYHRSQRMFISMASVTVIVLVIAGWLVLRSIIVPVRALQEAIEIAEREHDLTVTVNIKQNDEIGQVARAYQGMMHRFSESIAHIQQISAQLASNAEGLSKITAATSKDVVRQTQETDMVATASTEMSQAIQEVSSHAQSAADAANNANIATAGGTEVLQTAIASINRLADRIRGASEVVARVESDSASIGTVLDVIRGIAEQTNLLALNAAIEAARAGEQGRGFAVVADEVRSLAQRTQESTREIQNMIQRLQSGTREAGMTMETCTREMENSVAEAGKAGQSLALIAGAVDMISSMNTQIATATEQQMSVSQEISRNVVNIAEICKRSELSVRDVDGASLQVRSAAQTLDSIVTRFKI